MRATTFSLLGFLVALVVVWCVAFLFFPDASYERLMGWMLGAGIVGALVGWRSQS